MSFHFAISRSWMELNWSGFAPSAGPDLLQPVPLDHRGLEQGSGRVGVVLQQLRRAPEPARPS